MMRWRCRIAGIWCLVVTNVGASGGPPVDPDDLAAVARGRAEFTRSCVVCHGHGGTGGRGLPLAGRALAPDMIFYTVSKGRRRGSSVMPAFENALSVDQRWDLVAFVLSLGSRKHPADGNTH